MLTADIHVAATFPIQRRLLRNTGVQMIKAAQRDKEKYNPAIFVPRTDWQPLSTQEKRQLLVEQVSTQSKPGNTILFFKTETWLLEKFFSLYLQAVDKFPRDTERNLVNNRIFPEFLAAAEPILANICEYSDVSSKVIQVNVPGAKPRVAAESALVKNKLESFRRYSSTTSKSRHGFRGLHVDNWGLPRLSAPHRINAGVRIAINLGTEFREVVFINLTLQTITDLLLQHGDTAVIQPFIDESYATALAEQFLLRFPEYPAVKVRLLPGEGYIMPVQNMIHDGFPFAKKETDMNFMISVNQLRFRS